MSASQAADALATTLLASESRAWACQTAAVLRALSVLLAVPLLGLALGLAAACLLFGLSWWSAGVALCLLLFALSLLVLGKRRVLAISAASLLSVLLLARATVARSEPNMQLLVLPTNLSTRMVNKLFPERDGCLLAALALQLRGGLNDPEAGHFVSILRDAYARIPGDHLLPTPAIATYLGRQSPHAFDTIVFPPAAPTSAALIFLHGYAGNFHVYCWEIAQAAQAANLLTVCPSVSARGAWWESAGERTFLATLQYLRSIGIKRVYLAGLSNGGAGAATIASHHARELHGLILISGAARISGALHVPTLLIQGASDRMMPASLARAYAARRKNTTYRELPGGHFIFLSSHQRVRSAIADFLRKREQ